MTIQEAIDLQRELMKYCIDMDYTHSDYTSACDEILELNVMVCKALEKQIPMKTIIVHETDFNVRHYLCPLCDERVSEGANYCTECGQAISWGGTDKDD